MPTAGPPGRRPSLVSPGREIWRHASRYRVRYAVGLASLVVATGMSLAIPWTVKQAIDALHGQGGDVALGGYVTMILACAAGNGVARLVSRFAIAGAGQHVAADLLGRLYAAFQTFPPAALARYSTGDLMTRATSDVATVRSLAGFGVISGVSTALAFVGALAAMLAVDVWLTVWAMAPVPALVLLVRRFNGAVTARTLATQERLDVLSTLVQERLAGVAVVRAYTMEARAAGEFAAANAALREASTALARTQAHFTPLMGLVAGVGTLVVLWAGGSAVAAGQLSLGALVAFTGYLGYLAWPTVALGFTLSVVRRGLASMARVQQVLAEVHAPATAPTVAPVEARAPAIRFSGLTFAYPERAPVLRDVTFDVRAGEVVAVVGPTGSGKSTLGLLLARLWEPPPGAVFVEGADVTRLPLEQLRRRLAWVPQDAFLFSRELRDNVTLGRHEVDAAAATRAAAAAGVATEIDAFARGWDTVVGERGLTLSGGQRQRVALARAIAGAPPILVLDDVFANVDAAKETEILAGLRATAPTILLMTHRLRAAQHADRIIVLDGGRVIERGTHADLLGEGGRYATWWRLQRLEEEIASA
jgi:ATP-binding cassette subfamily B multidrug efflux pump